jgi:zinc protease
MLKSYRSRCYALLSLLLVLTLSPAQLLAADGTERPKQSSSAQSVTSIEGITEYRLQNGLRVLLYPEPSKPIVTVSITYLVGSRQESYGETGMAHLLEHLMFKGSPKHPKIPDELSLHGAKVNGSTTVDRTNYYEIFSASDANLDWALDLESDRMTNSFIAKKDLDSEMTVVRNELERGENSASRILQERVLETAFIWHNYGHPTIGARSDVENVPIERLQAFYRKYYQPDNAVLVVAGKFDEAKTLSLVEEKFGAIPKPARTLPAIYTEEPVQDGEREVVLRRTGQSQLLVVSYHVPPASHLDAIALDLLGDVLNQTPNGRLYKSLVETNLATGASASLLATHDPGMMSFSVGLDKDGNLEKAKSELIRMVEGIATQPISEEDLNRARAESLNSIERALTSADAVGMYLTDAIALGDWRLLFWERDQIKAVTTADLQRVAANYLVSSNRTVGLFIPEEKPMRALIPTSPDLAKVLNGYTGKEAVRAGEQIDATSAAIEARTKRGAVGPIKLALLEKQTRGNLVTAVLTFRFGNPEALRGRTTAGSLAAALLMTGSQAHSMRQLQDELTRLKAELNINGDHTHIAIQLKVPRENLGATLRLAAEIVRHPAYPEDQFDQMKRALLVAVKDSSLRPESIATKEIKRYLSPYKPGDVRYVETTDEVLANLRATTVEDVKKFHREFYGIGAGETAFVGPFDSNEIKDLLTTEFAGWKSPVSYKRITWDYKAIEGGKKSFNTPDKANAVVMAAGAVDMSELDPDYPALVLGNYILGGGFLNSRLATRIRQKEGLSYNVGSQVSVSALDRNGAFSITAICAPQNAVRVEQAYREEVTRALKEGFTAEEVSAAKTGLLQSRQMRYSDDEQIAATLASHLFIDRDLHWDERFDEGIRLLTPEQVQNAMRRYIHPEKLIVVEAVDYSKRKS